MSKTTAVLSSSKVEALRAALKNLQPKQKTSFTNREAVAELEKEIRHAQEKLGYSVADIAALWREQGIEIQDSTLRSYVRDQATGAGKPPIKRRNTKRELPLIDPATRARQPQHPETEPAVQPDAAPTPETAPEPPPEPTPAPEPEVTPEPGPAPDELPLETGAQLAEQLDRLARGTPAVDPMLQFLPEEEDG